MKYTIQKQHYHLAAFMGFFWGRTVDNTSKKKKKPREHKLSLIKISDFFNAIKNNPDTSITNFCSTPSAEKIMYSKLIYKETEDTMKVNTIEQNFYDLARDLSKKQDDNKNFITNYVCSDDEYEIVILFFCLQYVRNPNLYDAYLKDAFIRSNIDTTNLSNNDAINLIDRHIINSINDIILENFQYFKNKFKNYSFKIFENPNNDNLLIDHTVIKMNHNDYFKKLFGVNFDTIGSLLNNTYIITINSRFILVFYPEEFESGVHILKDLYFKHFLNIYILQARFIITSSENEEKLKLEIENFVNNIGIKNYVGKDSFIEDMEKKIRKIK